MENVCIIIVNWNAWRETIECLESVLRLRYPRFTVVLCDNGSTEDNVTKIRAWAEGEKWDRSKVNESLAYLSSPGIRKPVSYAMHSQEEAERGGEINKVDEHQLHIVRVSRNLGFAGGTNVGIRFAIARGGFDYLWLLNNDTVVPPDSLRYLVEAMRQKTHADMAGSTIVFYSEPSRIQARGGATYNRWLGRNANIGSYDNVNEPADVRAVERKMSYIVGAALLVRGEFVERVGLLNENLFLYFEELDWALRGDPCRLAYVPESTVYHREGTVLGSSSKGSARSELADYYYTRNRIRITRTYFPSFLPSVYIGVGASILARILRRQWSRLRVIWKACHDAWSDDAQEIRV